MDQRMQGLNRDQFLERGPLWGKHMLTRLAMDQGRENDRQIAARREALFAGVGGEARFLGQPRELGDLAGVELGMPDRHGMGRRIDPLPLACSNSGDFFIGKSEDGPLDHPS